MEEACRAPPAFHDANVRRRRVEMHARSAPRRAVTGGRRPPHAALYDCRSRYHRRMGNARR